MVRIEVKHWDGVDGVWRLTTTMWLEARTLIGALTFLVCLQLGQHC